MLLASIVLSASLLSQNDTNPCFMPAPGPDPVITLAAPLNGASNVPPDDVRVILASSDPSRSVRAWPWQPIVRIDLVPPLGALRVSKPPMLVQVSGLGYAGGSLLQFDFGKLEPNTNYRVLVESLDWHTPPGCKQVPRRDIWSSFTTGSK